MITSLTIKFSKVWNHPGFRRYFANTAWLFAEKILRMVVGLFVGVWVARYLGPERFGLLSYAQAFVGLFSAIATLGLDGIVVRELVKDESKRDVLLGTSFVLKLLGAFLVFLVLAVAVRFTKNDAFTNLLIFIIASGLIFQSFNVIDLYFQSKVLSKFAVLANTISFLTSSLIKVVLLIIKAPLIAFAVVAVCDTFIAAIGYMFFYSKYGSGAFTKWKFNFEVAKSLLKDSWPLVFSGIVIMIYMRIDQVMIKNMLGDWSVGQYAAAVRLTEVFLFIPVIITKSLMPSVIKAKKISVKLYYDRLQSLYQFLIFIAFIIAVLVFFTRDELISLLYGEAYFKASKILGIYVWSNIFVYMNNASWQWYIAENLQYLASLRLGLGALANVLLNLYTIPRWGIAGAALATLISYSIATYFGNLISKKTIPNFILLTKALFNWNIKKYKDPF
ncbi:flippase [Thermodesulfatator autotrophicus]|uniref:Flippase n=1 Tax=Thermodesulfatator autotrophicus TaxID=1795632 RepID=A0A177E731_9BACT|nr:flippase [Thermodesulfatator autotrophicus]OAG27032.1 flippase [Thermodesulfatator autotrophicus]